jgi:glycosyltransferase involved in cell wall biosynthesis
MRFHCLGVPHTVTSPEYNACAFTTKVRRFIDMMTARGHECIHYGHEDSKVNCENVICTTNADLQKAYGSYDWRKSFFKHDMNDSAHRTFHANAIREITKRKHDHDFLLPFWGWGVWPVCEAHQDMIVVEPGIGYPSVTPARWKVFESYAIYHAHCGMESVGKCQQDWYHVVIPNYFDHRDFTFSADKDDYFLFLGRVYSGKGVEIAIQVTERLGKKLIIAGQTDGSIAFPPHVEYVGYADTEKRRQLMSRAKASFVPSLYNEPFGGVGVENLFSGTPIITTDWGAFTEYNTDGVTGYRCRTFGEFIKAASSINKIDPLKCRERAMERFTYDAVAPQYERFFQNVLDVHGGDGWYTVRDQG